MNEQEYIKKAKTELKRCYLLLVSLEKHWPEKDREKTLEYLSKLDAFIALNPKD